MPKQTSVSGLLPAERIVVGLKAKSLTDAVDQLIDRLDSPDVISDRPALDREVAAELARGDLPTLGQRAILAHFRSDAVDQLAVAFGTATKPFAFAPAQAPKALFLAVILTPRTAAKQYLKAVAALTELIADPGVADSMAAARSPQEFLQAVSARDLAIRPELMVRDLMSREFHAVSPQTLVSEALRVMVRHRRRGLPVVSDNGEVLGMVSEQELLQYFLPQILGTAPLGDGAPPPVEDVEVRDVMQRSVMCLSEDQLISDVLGTMLSEHVSQFPVVKEGKLVGFLSRTDLIRKLIDQSI